MKNLVLTIIFASILTTNANAAPGAEGGGGGGVFCTSTNKCMTISEAGLRVKLDPILSPKADQARAPKAPGAFVITNDVIQEVNAILNDLRKKTKLNWLDEKFLNLETDYNSKMNDIYKVVEAYDSEKFKKAKSDYQTILKYEGINWEFSIAAVSDANNTYLLPDYLKLNTRSKALTIIHENVVRKLISRIGRFEAVKFALQLDGVFLDVLEGKQTDPYTLVSMDETLDGRNKFYNSPMVRYVQSQLAKGKKIKWDDLAVASMVSNFGNGINLSNERLAYDIYLSDAGLWNILNSEGTRKIKSFPVVGIPADPVDLSLYCENTDDGYYFIGSHILRCQKSEGKLVLDVVYESDNQKICNPEFCEYN